MAQIITRKLDQNGDPQRGNGLSNFAADIDAVAVIVAERLQLLKGEWFENTKIGLPLFQSLLGHATTQRAVALILRQNILGAPGVTGIQAVQVVYNPIGRTYAFTATIQTVFGPMTITNTPRTAGGSGGGVIGQDVTWLSLSGTPWSAYLGTSWQ